MLKLTILKMYVEKRLQVDSVFGAGRVAHFLLAPRWQAPLWISLRFIPDRQPVFYLCTAPRPSRELIVAWEATVADSLCKRYAHW